MAATITTKFRLENANTFIKSIADDSVYIMLGKSDTWSTDKDDRTDAHATAPLDIQLEENDMWQNAIALKKLGASDAINVVPRYNWTSGTRYVGWDDIDAAIFAKRFYVLNENYDLFKCLKAPLSSLILSTNAPAITTSPHAFSTPDGYIWKYMGKISTPNVTKFMTVNYMPVKTITPPAGGASLSADEATQYDYQVASAAATSGKIYRYEVINGGSGYLMAPTVTISGNGSGAVATAVVLGGVVTAINVTGEENMMQAPSAGPGANTYRINCGSGYTSAYVTIGVDGQSGTGATARAILSPKNGHGTDQTRELGGFYVETNVTLTGAEGAGADFITGANFRQIALVKNPLDFGTTDISSTATLSALKTMKLTAAPTSGTLESGDYITGDSSSACAFVDSYALESTNHIIRYHQNDKTGYGAFSNGEGITSFGGQTATIAASGGFGNPEVQPCSGDIMFIENRAPITRAVSQIEDIRLVIEF